MMLRSRKLLANIPRVAVKRQMARKKNLRQSLSEVHIEEKGKTKCSSSVLLCGSGLCQVLSSCDCISGGEQSSSAAEHSSISQTKNNQSTEVEMCSSTVLPSSTSPPQVLPNSNQIADVQPSSVPEDSICNLEMEDSILELIPTEVSDVSVLEKKSHQKSSNSNKSTEADTSDIIIIPDSPIEGSVRNQALKNTSHEVLQLQQSRKRKNTDMSGVEILCDISASRPKKQQKMDYGIKDKKLWTNTAIMENFTVKVSGKDRTVSQLTKNKNSEDVINITSKKSDVDGDDIILISAEDEEVSVISTKRELKPHQEDIIILDSPPAQTPVQSSDKKPKKMVSASTSITGLIPHYTKNLIDFISLEGKPPATTSGSFTGTPLLPADSRGRRVMHKHIPDLRRHHRKHRHLSKNRVLNARSRDPAVQTNSIPVPTCSSTSHTLSENRSSAVRNPAQVSKEQNSTTQNTEPEKSLQSTSEVPQSPACSYGTNIYNPNASEKEEDGLRPVILDGNNIAMGHGKGKCFSWRGLHICIKYFLKRGHKVTAFVPTFRRGVCPPELRSEMEEYERSGQVVFTPSRRVEGRLIVAYDDRFIVQCAAELGGVIVSTDNFRDLLSENSSWKETIEKRLLMFTWVGDLLMFPHDPLGRYGPKFEEFLRFPKKL